MTASAQERDEATSSIDVTGSAAPAPALVDMDIDAEAHLDAAGELIADDPGRAESEIAACRAWFVEHGPEVLKHRATYLLAQALVARGRLEEAMPLIDEARNGFEACGERVLALRTNLGRSHALFELGRLDDAMVANERLIAGLDDIAHDQVFQADADYLCAAAHQNIGILEFHAGRASAALESFDTASAHVDVEDDVLAPMIVVNRARALMALGRIAEAASDLERSVASLGPMSMRADRADTMAKLAEAQILTGDFAAALETVRRADEILRSIDAPFHRHEHSMIAGQAYLALNLNQESIDAFREAQKWLHDAGLAGVEALATWGIGLALAALGHHRQARDEFDAAADLFRSTGQSTWLARTLLARARVLDALGERDLALRSAREALGLATTTSALIEVVQAQLVCADLGDDPEARRRASLDIARQLGLAPVLLTSIHAFGRQLLAADDAAGARVLLGEAVGLVEQQRSQLHHETLLGSFAHDKRAIYSDLVRAHLDDDADISRAAQIADGSKSRSLLDLAHGASRGRVGGGVDGAMVERSALERDLHAAYHELFAASGDDADRFASLSARAAELERQVSRLRLGELDSGALSTTARDGAYEPPAVPVLSYVALDDELIAFVVDEHGVEVVRSLVSIADVDVLVQRLAAQRDRSRLDAGLANRHAARFERTCRSLLGSLYDAIIAPVEHLLPHASDDVVAPLVVSPCGVLHSIPFHALWDGTEYLRDRFSISIAPSIGVLQSCEARRARRVGRAVVVGVADDLAPRAEHEALSIGAMLENSIALLGDQASVATVLDAARGADLLHLACHGWFRADNPMFSAIRLADRWLLAHEILDELDLPGSTVVLSACETGRAGVNGGDELLGLVRAFIGAGASTLVASLWPADDALTEQLMASFYRQLPDRGPAEAMRLAQQELGEHVTNPNLWAPFVVIGAR